jgi:hypothetical protein
VAAAQVAAAAACIGDGGGHGEESQDSDPEEDIEWKSMTPAEHVMNHPDRIPKALASVWNKAWEAKGRVDCLKRIDAHHSLQAEAQLSADAAAADFAAAYAENANECNAWAAFWKEQICAEASASAEDSLAANVALTAAKAASATSSIRTDTASVTVGDGDDPLQRKLANAD